MLSDALATTKIAGSGIAGLEIAALRGALPQPIPAPAPAEIDACLYLFALCKYFQMTRLKGQRLDCRVDGEGVGKLPEAVCRLLGLMVCELIKAGGAATAASPTTSRKVAVTLRKRGTTCLCLIAGPAPTGRDLAGSGNPAPQADPAPGLQRVRQLAGELSAGCLVRAMPERGLTAILLDIRSVDGRLPTAISRHRSGDVRH